MSRATKERKRILLDGVSLKTTACYFGTRTISTSPATWEQDICRLFGFWKKVGYERTLDSKRAKPKGVSGIVRGMAAVHFLNKHGEWSPHLHSVLMCSRSFDPRPLEDFWHSLTGGIVEVEKARNFGGAVRYSVAGEVPESPEEKVLLQEFTHGKHLIRKIGR